MKVNISLRLAFLSFSLQSDNENIFVPLLPKEKGHFCVTVTTYGAVSSFTCIEMLIINRVNSVLVCMFIHALY